MKKTLSVVLALIMVLTMCLPAFAYEMTTPKPEEPDDTIAWTAYYTEMMTHMLTEPGAILTLRSEVVKDIA